MHPRDTRLGSTELEPLFALEATAPLRFRSLRHEGNLNGHGHAFGGQLLGQALMAAAHTVDGRAPISLQLHFLKGTDVGAPIEYAVSCLSDGRQFSHRQVVGAQGGSATVVADVAFQMPAPDSWNHSLAFDVGSIPAPGSLPSVAELNIRYREPLARMNYVLFERPCMDFRLLDAEAHLFEPSAAPRMRWWARLRRPLSDDPRIHAAALAYLSDWWTCFAVVAPHIPIAGARDRIYMASLNHSLWLHGPPTVDDWLLFTCESPYAGSSRGLSTGHIHDRHGRLLATMAQECVARVRTHDRPPEPVPA
ncbi:acyl-CoA thioesterase [Fulvimonas soli]|uniref:Acyl-CoA thioesterase-2 n=1 Tax=Fulvimonas soli TaxID=155197 RepID=A0A316IGX7_9GAMM|nr:acyl-CoA thioesterase domain-containing protein [Fulvimonas soli]PWK91926.1 acyl-CoA thioesterase-2 [Fulvimonas soli]TNY26051.1 hypothetical protein BV497_10890 [Fulvimonas soli]